MNRDELVKAISEDIGVSQALAKRVLGSMVKNIAKAITKGDLVQIREFGRFYTRKRAGRFGRHPQTGQIFHVPATTVPQFEGSPKLKATVAAKGRSYKPSPYR